MNNSTVNNDKSYSELKSDIEQLERKCVLIRIGNDTQNIDKCIKIIASALMNKKLMPSGMWHGRCYLINNHEILKYISIPEHLHFIQTPKGAYVYLKLLISKFSLKSAIDILNAL